MPKTRVVLYREEDGSCPFLDWFSNLSTKAQDKCYLRLERLRDLGHELRRPEADYLRDGIYERIVPPKENGRALRSKERFEANPATHTYEEA